MDINLADPHNHVPEVTPADEWGDADGLHPNFNAAATVLPPKRIKAEGPSSNQPGRNNGDGLRIESKPQRRENAESGQQLEVQQIDGSVVRLDPEEPSVARVPRHIAFHELPAREPEDIARRGEGKEWGRSRSQSFRWILGTGAGVATMVVVAMMMLPSINKSNAAREGEGGPILAPEEDVKGSEALNAMLSRQPEAEQLFKRYASALIADDALPLLRNPESVESFFRASFRPGIVSKDWVPGDDTQWSVYEAEGVQYGILEGTLPDFNKFQAYMIFSGNQLYLDWKASTAHGSATFEELSKQEGNPAEIRAMISPAGFYTAVFPEAEYQSYQFVSADKEQAIWCYARKDDRANAALAPLFKTGIIVNSAPEQLKVTLRLERGPDGALPNQWVIAEMLHKDWLIPK